MSFSIRFLNNLIALLAATPLTEFSEVITNSFPALSLFGSSSLPSLNNIVVKSFEESLSVKDSQHASNILDISWPLCQRGG